MFNQLISTINNSPNLTHLEAEILESSRITYIVRKARVCDDPFMRNVFRLAYDHSIFLNDYIGYMVVSSCEGKL